MSQPIPPRQFPPPRTPERPIAAPSPHGPDDPDGPDVSTDTIHESSGTAGGEPPPQEN